MTTFRRCSFFMIIVLVLLAAPRIRPGHAQGTAPAADCPATCLYFPLVTAQPDVSIISAGYYSSYLLYGQYSGAFVTNRGKSVTNIVMEVETMGQNTEVITPVFSVTLPGMHNYFRVSTAGAIQNPRTAVIRSYDVVTQTSALMLPVLAKEVSWDAFSTVVSGTIQNTSPYTLTNVRVLIELDGPGSLADFSDLGAFAPGAIVPYKGQVRFYDGTNPGPTNVIVQAQGLIDQP
jgi:hypothetical protein